MRSAKRRRKRIVEREPTGRSRPVVRSPTAGPPGSLAGRSRSGATRPRKSRRRHCRFVSRLAAAPLGGSVLGPILFQRSTASLYGGERGASSHEEPSYL